MYKLKNILVTLFLCLTISIGYSPLLVNALDDENTSEVEETQEESKPSEEEKTQQDEESKSPEEDESQEEENKPPEVEETDETKKEEISPVKDEEKSEEPTKKEEPTETEEKTPKQEVEEKQYTITVNYIDENNQIIDQFISEEMDENTHYDFTQYTEKTIKGYEFVQVTGDELTGTLNSNKVINVYYNKIIEKTYSITINFLEEKTNKTLKSTIIIKNLKENQKYTIGNYQIDGYTCISKDNKTVKITDKDQVVNLYYRKRSGEKYTITVNYIDENNNKIIDSFVSEKMPQESDYNVTKFTNKKIKGYELVKKTGDKEIGILNCNKVINVHYKKIISTNNVKTSDDSHLYMWLAAGIISFIIIIIISKKYKK